MDENLKKILSSKSNPDLKEIIKFCEEIIVDRAQDSTAKLVDTNIEIENHISYDWYPGDNNHVYIGNYLDYVIDVRIVDVTNLKKKIKSEKAKLVTETEVVKFLENLINDKIYSDFVEYCDSDDYYPPCAEDYDLYYVIEHLEKELGCEIEILSYHADDDGEYSHAF